MPLIIVRKLSKRELVMENSFPVLSEKIIQALGNDKLSQEPFLPTEAMIRTSFKDKCHDQYLEKELFIVNPWKCFPVQRLGRNSSLKYFWWVIWNLKAPIVNSASWRDYLSWRMLILNPYCPSSEKQRLLWRHVTWEKEIIPTLIVTLL